MTRAIEVRHLTKSYGEVHAVRGIDLRVDEGEVFALLGPNGAGKTTTVEILEGFRRPTSGEVEVLGYDPARGGTPFKERIGIVLQSTGIEPYLSVAETIDMYRSYFPRPRPRDEIIEVVGLETKREEPVRKLSGGQQRRLDVAIGLAGDPDLLFLDEPTTGFDPAARRQAWDMVRNLQELGKTVFLTTHYMDEAQNLAGRVAIIVEGKIVAEGAPNELSPQANEAHISTTLPLGAPPLPEDIAAQGRVEGNSFSAVSTNATRLVNSLTGWAIENDIELIDLKVGGATLEDVYLELTGSGGSERGTE